MRHALAAKSDAAHEPSASLRFLSNATVALAVLPLVLLYAQWVLSWGMLGHVPRPDIDDPKYIDGASWMQMLTEIAFVLWIPAALIAIAVTVWYGASGRASPRALAWRIGAVGGALLFLFLDPVGVFGWWID